MTGSSKRSELDLARVPTTPEDVAALRRVRATRHLTTEEYLRALARLPTPPIEALRTRKHARGGEPFRLVR
jgi:hypothetical protein